MEISFWNSEFKSQYCETVEEPLNLLHVAFAHSVNTELIVYARLTREHKICETNFYLLLTHSFLGEIKFTCKKL